MPPSAEGEAFHRRLSASARKDGSERWRRRGSGFCLALSPALPERALRGVTQVPPNAGKEEGGGQGWPTPEEGFPRRAADTGSTRRFCRLCRPGASFRAPRYGYKGSALDQEVQRCGI